MIEEVDTFLEYLCVQNIEKNSGWFEAIKGDDWCPSTTNRIECNNKLVKDDHTFRERWILGRFCSKTIEIVERLKEIPRITQMPKSSIRYW